MDGLQPAAADASLPFLVGEDVLFNGEPPEIVSFRGVKDAVYPFNCTGVKEVYEYAPKPSRTFTLPNGRQFEHTLYAAPGNLLPLDDELQELVARRDDARAKYDRLDKAEAWLQFDYKTDPRFHVAEWEARAARAAHERAEAALHVAVLGRAHPYDKRAFLDAVERSKAAAAAHAEATEALREAQHKAALARRRGGESAGDARVGPARRFV